MANSVSAPQDGAPVVDVAWHCLSVDEVARRLDTDLPNGLDPAVIAERARRSGPNELKERRRRGPVSMFFGQFTDFMILVLIVAAVIAGVIGDVKDTLAIIVIVLLNAIIGFIQEFRAERAMAALKKLSPAFTRVVRAGETMTIAADQLVPGDVVLLETGNVIPADLRLTETVQLKTDESALTGESLTVDKLAGSLANADLPLGDRRNMAYKGTIATFGRGRGVVVATGMATELGKIATLLDQADDAKTPLQKRLAHVGKRLALAAIAICAIVFLAGVIRGESVALMFLTAVSLAVAAIPEALPAVVTISLALGAHRMVRHNALVRRLPAVETLGSVSYICSDKTGTLTRNEMKVEAIYADGLLLTHWIGHQQAQPWSLLFNALALSNDASLDRLGRVSGDPTETALFLAAREAGADKTILERAAPRLMEAPFDSERKRMTTLHRAAQGVIAFTKGAPESVLTRCRRALTSAGIVDVQADDLLGQAERLAADGWRVLAFAYRMWSALPATTTPESLEDDLTFLALVALADPPRDEAATAVGLCQSAGIIPVMITGDHPVTARAIAIQLGIPTQDAMVMTGAELAKMSEDDFERKVKDIRVYARVDPAQKIRIVQALQDHGEFVAMTGDGVNDAPALRRADIGVAMGKGGTDVARGASSLVLLDDNFATIVHAVREGRRIYDNIRKFIRYAVTCNSGEIWTLFLAPFLGLPIPLLPIHILWINLVTDGLPGLALAMEPAEKGVMQRPPRPPQESIFAHGLWQHIVWVGLLMGGVSLVTQAWAYHTGSAHWQSMVFTVLTLSQLGHVLAIRAESASTFAIGLFSNRPLAGAVALTFALQLATLYWTPLNPIFRTEPLDVDELVLCLALSSVVFFAVEVEKWFVRRGWLYREMITAGNERESRRHTG
jgi:Ca2+-transporting ATPase